MSYCRWSDDGFQCDVYCYESSAGFVTHVASRHGLPHDGESFVDATEDEMFERLQHLQALGYMIPEWVFT